MKNLDWIVPFAILLLWIISNTLARIRIKNKLKDTIILVKKIENKLNVHLENIYDTFDGKGEK